MRYEMFASYNMSIDKFDSLSELQESGSCTFFRFLFFYCCWFIADIFFWPLRRDILTNEWRRKVTFETTPIERKSFDTHFQMEMTIRMLQNRFYIFKCQEKSFILPSIEIQFVSRCFFKSKLFQFFTWSVKSTRGYILSMLAFFSC